MKMPKPIPARDATIKRAARVASKEAVVITAPTAPRPPGYDVFVSHSSKDKAAADAACHALEARDIRCWIAPRDIRPGANWGEAILEGISSARIMVLLLSSHANASPQIQREVERAVHHGAIVIPVRIEEVMPARSLEYFLSTSHWLDAFRPPLKAHWQHLADTVQGILGQEVAPPVPTTVGKPPGRYRPALAMGAVGVAALAAVAWWEFQHAQKQPASASTPAISSVNPAVASVTVPPSNVAPAPTVAIVIAPTPTSAPSTPPPEPPPPAIAEFAGTWEISTMIMKDSEGNQVIYQPIRFTINESGQVSGKATATMESKNGKPKFVQPPRVAVLTGTISAPENKKHMASASALDANNFSYKVATIQFKLNDGTEGRGLVGLTENLPVSEYVTMSKGEVSGRMIAMKQ